MKSIDLDWDYIQTVFLDMDGTLLDLHFDNHFWLEHVPLRFADRQCISLDESKKHLQERLQSIEGTLNWYCLDHWSKTLDMDILALKHDVAEKIAIRDRVEDFLRFLNEQGRRVVLLTNAHPKTIDLKFQYVQIEQYFDRIITSHQLKLSKETHGFWEKLSEIESYNADHSLFIDDNLAVLAEAERAGVKHLLAIHQPDSQRPPVATKHYQAVECFSQLMP